jgi:hypothetical protein
VNIIGLPAGHAGGGGLRCGDGLPRIENNRITYNSGLYGGGIVLNFTGAILKNNVIAYDTAGSAYFAGGGVWINGNYSGSSAQIINNTIAYNFASTVGSSAGGIAIYAGTPNVRNDIITNNTGTFQIYSQTFLWVYFCNVQGGYAGQGNINADPLFIGGPSGGFYLSQIAAGQTVNSPCMNAGDTLSAMIMGTTRNDGVQDAGIVDMGYHYPLPLPAIDVTMTPLAPPIVIPANGGSFQFNACVRRTTGPPAPFWAWARDRNPNGTYTGILLGPVQINPPVGVQVQRLRTQVVAASWQTGLHHYVGYAHSSVSYPATDTDSFSWTKSATADGGPWIEEASCSGELFPGEKVVSSSHRDSFEQPSAFTLTSISPNPFNSTTTIGYEIRSASKVELNIYNLRGEVIRNFSRNNPGGGGSFTWDGTDRNGSPVGSGIYLCRLKGGNNTATQRIVLLK